jgi:hypothetical protein
MVAAIKPNKTNSRASQCLNTLVLACLARRLRGFVLRELVDFLAKVLGRTAHQVREGHFRALYGDQRVRFERITWALLVVDAFRHDSKHPQ